MNMNVNMLSIHITELFLFEKKNIIETAIFIVIMNLIKIIKDHIRGFNYDSHTEITPGYTIESIEIESKINRDLSIIITFLFFGLFWLGMENYMNIVQYIIEFCRQRRI